jgi:putative DNA methylase
MSHANRRLIEDLIPLREISAEASREKSLRHGNISTLHLWWARRPIVAARAAVYGALVPAPDDDDERSIYMGRMKNLCKWEPHPDTLGQARQDILEANDGQPPRILDMFAGGGSIPLEALRLGCEATAIDLNPVAHIIELCTLVYPQKYGPSLVADVKKWGLWVIERAREQLAEFYPVPDTHDDADEALVQSSFTDEGNPFTVKSGLTPIAYLWTRTVPCPNPSCGATVPLVRQTWLRKKAGHYAALKMVPDDQTKKVRFELVQASKLEELGFDPEAGSKAGNATCPFCGATVSVEYVKACGQKKQIDYQFMAVVVTRSEGRGKLYLASASLEHHMTDKWAIEDRIERLCKERGLSIPDEPLPVQGTLGFRIQAYGMLQWKDLFTPRQLLALLTFSAEAHSAYETMLKENIEIDYAKAITTYIALLIDKLADFNSTICRWVSVGDKVANTYARQALPMIWDFSEINPFGNGSGNSVDSLQRILSAVDKCIVSSSSPAKLVRTSAMQLPLEDASVDAVITDPPYYDNVPYADLSDFFYVWLKRTIGFLYPEHLNGKLAPKRQEAIAEPARHKGNMQEARCSYENMMAQSFAEAHRVLKPGGPLICVYAHKTTLGWSTLIEALRRAGFVIVEAWPLDTERPGRVRDIGSAALATSIFLVARRRENESTGDYIIQVRPELTSIISERLDTLIKEGVSGADLMIAALGAGLRAYTQYARVELPNGDELDAESYLFQVQREVTQHILHRLLSAAQGNGQQPIHAGMHTIAIDAPTLFYVIGRYFYEEAAVPFDDMNLLARSIGVELDGPHGLAQGKKGLAKKAKEAVQLCDYRSRGDDERLGLPTESGNPAPLIDVLQRLLWLQDKQPYRVPEFLGMARPNVEQLRQVADTLKGTTLAPVNGNGASKHERSEEQKAVETLLQGWRSTFSERSMLRERTLWNYQQSID